MITSSILTALLFGSVIVGRNLIHEKNSELWEKFKVFF